VQRTTKADALRRSLQSASAERRAILFLLCSLDQIALADIEQFVSKLPSMSKRELEGYETRLENLIGELRRDYGVVPNRTELTETVGRALAGAYGDGAVYPVAHTYISKGWFEANIRHYAKVLKTFDILPVHARIGLPVPPQNASTDIFLPEAVLFENAAMLFNECLLMSQDAETLLTQLKLKRYRALLHSCYSTAFHFIEAYLNGIAFNFAYKKAGFLKEEDFSMLLEFDLEKQRQRNVSFRNKLLQYPRILTGNRHPPLTESNVPEMNILLGEGKQFRDAIVHPSPRPSIDEILKRARTLDGHAAAALRSRGEVVLNKEDYLIQSDFASLTRVIDATIAVVRRIEEAIDGYMIKLGYLTNRGGDGLFPPETFR
jgi:hypothetical protein